MKRWFFPFRQGDAEVSETGPELLGAKGANLAEMCRIQLPVPPGFTITMELCRRFLGEGSLPAEFEMSLREGIAFIESATNRRLGDARRPHLVSARSGRVYAGALPIVEENEPPELRTIRAWIGEEGIADHPLAGSEINRIGR